MYSLNRIYMYLCITSNQDSIDKDLNRVIYLIYVFLISIGVLKYDETLIGYVNVVCKILVYLSPN